jgi:hypothetical protein
VYQYGILLPPEPLRARSHHFNMAIGLYKVRRL